MHTCILLTRTEFRGGGAELYTPPDIYDLLQNSEQKKNEVGKLVLIMACMSREWHIAILQIHFCKTGYRSLSV